MTKDELFLALIVTQRALTRITKTMSSIGLDADELMDDEDLDLSTILFDAMGVPKDNTVDYDLNDPTAPGGPDECFCRDWWYGQLFDPESELKDDELLAEFKASLAELQQSPSWSLWDTNKLDETWD
ncbi:MAG TPA: hypothetical protein VMW24_19340 [Sedimentisphaerales bacterium]|nr:hypothetical protein [Sedimentisphaerales bacterium]